MIHINELVCLVYDDNYMKSLLCGGEDVGEMALLRLIGLFSAGWFCIGKLSCLVLKTILKYN